MSQTQVVGKNRFLSANLPSYLPLRLAPVRKTTQVIEAAENAPNLGGLVARAQSSHEFFRVITHLLPPSMRSAVSAGAFEEDGAWCLVASNNAVAAKLRQLLPALLAHLRSKGKNLQSIRIKISSS